MQRTRSSNASPDRVGPRRRARRREADRSQQRSGWVALFPCLALRGELVDLPLNLREAFRLDIELLVDVVEVGHDHIEHLVVMQRTGEALWSFATGLPYFPAPPDRARQS